MIILQFMRTQKASKYLNEATQLEIKEEDNYGEFVIMTYMLNPFTIITCVGQTTTVFGNLATALCILSMLKGKSSGLMWHKEFKEHFVEFGIGWFVYSRLSYYEWSYSSCLYVSVSVSFELPPAVYDLYV
jgi:hypothetical protein